MTEFIDIAVAGLHLSGQKLNHQLTALDGKFKETCRTAGKYKMYLIEDERGKKPGLIRLPDHEKGNSYEIEIWTLPVQNVGRFLLNIPPPLGLGTLLLENGTSVKGFICEYNVALEGKDISAYPGWRKFMEETS